MKPSSSRSRDSSATPRAGRRCPLDNQRPLHQRLRHRGAEAEVAAAYRHGRARLGHRDDRTRHRLRPAKREDPGPCATATTTSSTGRRRSSPTAPTPTSSSSWRAQAMSPGRRGLSLIVAEVADLPGFSRGRVLDKVGLHGQDTRELFFEDMRVPAENVLGGTEGRGFLDSCSSCRTSVWPSPSEVRRPRSSPSARRSPTRRTA